MNIIIVVPVFNEEKHIGNVLKELLKIPYDVVVVDDGSSDSSFNVAKRFKKATVVHHKVNLGKGAALKTGAEAAFKKGADAVVFMDSDEQHSVGDIEKFIEKLESGKVDVVFGSRNLGLGVPLVRFLGNKFFSVLIGLLFGIYVSDALGGFRGLTKKAYKKIKWESLGYSVEIEMVIRTKRSGLKHCEVPVESIYLDNVKGVTFLDAIDMLFRIVSWRIKL